MAETIAAIATAQATGAIAILRLSGDTALEVAKCVFKSKADLDKNIRKMCYGEFLARDGKAIDSGLAVYMKAPNSYTGEDTVELFCHGSLVSQREILEALCANGARHAKAGEFTRRAFLNGKLELSQAEAVIDLIDAETVEAARNAEAQLEGHMGKKITAVRDKILDVIASFYAYVDYPDEEITENSQSETVKILNSANDILSKLYDSFDQGRILKDGVRCALVGRPNVGKSSVLNALLGYDRSIVSDIPGTTRDTVEEKVRVGNIHLRLIDTAGLRASSDEIEKIGIERTEKSLENAELVLAVFDGSNELKAEDEKVIALSEGKCAIALVNKNDLDLKINIQRIKDSFGERVCVLSARENSGIDELCSMICEIFENREVYASGEIITNARHAQAIFDAKEKISSAINTLESGFTPDIAISDLEGAVDKLGEITGQTASEQILGRIFERFCVGK